MIIAPYTVILLGIAVLTAVLALPIGWGALVLRRKMGSAISGEERDAVENGVSLLLLASVTVLFVKLPAWPLFYAALQSCIPHVHGAMCIYGVMQAKPVLSTVSQILKPIVFFFSGSWLFIHYLSEQTGSPALLQKKLVLLFFVSVLILADSVDDMVYFTSFDTSTYVACCTTVLDLPAEKSALLFASFLGTRFDHLLLAAYYGTNGLLVVLLDVSSRRGMARTLALPLAAGFAVVFCAGITIAALFAVIAPKIMKLPYHHCIYCMWQYAPMSILMTGLFIAGIFATGWGLMVEVSGRKEQRADMFKEIANRLYRVGEWCLGASLIMATLGFTVS
jgi:hypothetical protein